MLVDIAYSLRRGLLLANLVLLCRLQWLWLLSQMVWLRGVNRLDRLRICLAPVFLCFRYQDRQRRYS